MSMLERASNNKICTIRTQRQALGTKRQVKLGLLNGNSQIFYILVLKIQNQLGKMRIMLYYSATKPRPLPQRVSSLSEDLIIIQKPALFLYQSSIENLPLIKGRIISDFKKQLFPSSPNHSPQYTIQNSDKDFIISFLKTIDGDPRRQSGKTGQGAHIHEQRGAQKWGSTASIYQRYDSCMQTGFYTLTSMMKLSEAHSMLEVACGTGRLLPHAMSLKPQSCTYLATDISEEMVFLSKAYLSRYISKLGVQIPLEEWLARQRLSFLVHNGEEPLPIGLKFDRIICNFVLHLTQSPEKMLKSLYDSAESGCLLGVTINGSIEESNLLNALKETKEELGVVQTFRSYAFLHNKFGQMAERTGWEVLVSWQRTMPYVFLQVDESLNDFIVHILKLDDKISQRLKQKLAVEFLLQRGLQLSAQLYICRKE